MLVLLLSATVIGLLTDSSITSMEWNGMSQEKRRVHHHCRMSSLLFSLDMKLGHTDTKVIRDGHGQVYKHRFLKPSIPSM